MARLTDTYVIASQQNGWRDFREWVNRVDSAMSALRPLMLQEWRQSGHAKHFAFVPDSDMTGVKAFAYCRRRVLWSL
jgi:hypothetical protein